MTTTPSNAQLKIPTFNTSTFRLAQLVPDRSGITAINSSTGIGVKKQPIVMNVPPSSCNTTTNITTTKISVDGKVIDIDVLTKLQQKNGGNIVSFTASKELLSNLANNKLTSKNPVSINLATKQRNVKPNKAIAVTVYGAPGVKHFNPGVNPTVKMTNEKFLLPKTSTKTPSYHPYSLKKSQVEVKKFAPEINGLLSGLRGGPIPSASANNAPGNDMKSIKAYTMKNQAVAISFIGEKNKTKGATVLLPARNATSTSGNLKANTTVKTIVHNSTTAKTKQQYLNKADLMYSGSVKTSSIKNPTYCFKSASTSQICNSKVSRPSIIVSTPTSAIVENKTYRFNKNIQENNNRTSGFKIKTLLLQDVLKKESAAQALKEKKNKGGLEGFEKLYEDAVNNVLKIKVFPDDLDSKKSKETLKEIEAEFKNYLETPMDIEKKINEGVFKYSKKKRPSSTYKDDRTEEKKPKLIDSEHLAKYLKGYKPYSSYSGTPTTNFNSPASTRNVESSSTNKKSDNQNFFSQFLADQTKIPKPFNTPSFFSPMDYPWFYPSYLYAPKFFSPNKPPPLVPHQTFPPLNSDSRIGGTEPRIKEEQIQEVSPVDERKTRTRSVTNSLPTKSKYGHRPNTKENKPDKQNKPTGKSTNLKSKKKDDIKREELYKKTLPIKKEILEKDNDKSPKSKADSTDAISRRPVAISASEKRLRNKDNLKFRYSLRQRAKALKKAKKLAKLKGEDKPRFILKKLDKKTSTKKELFLANFGLRRILKRIQNPPPLVQD